MRLNERMRSLRKYRRLTLRQLQELIDRDGLGPISISHIHTIETRDDASAGLMFLARVARGYGMSIQQLLEGVDLFEPIPPIKVLYTADLGVVCACGQTVYGDEFACRSCGRVYRVSVYAELIEGIPA